MVADQPSQPEEKQKPPSVVAQTFDIVRRTEPQTGRPRQLFSAGALGVCLLFIAGMLSLPRLDEALTIGLFAFVIAMPLLVVDHLTASYKADAEQRNLMLSAFVVAGWLVGDTLGPIAVYGGVVAVVWHLNRTAGILLLLWSVGVMVIVLSVMLAGVLIYVFRKVRAERRNETPSLTSQPETAGE